MIQLKHEKLAKEIREILIHEASKTPDMHLAPSLGVVELMIALFEVFNFHKDTLIFDVGHQRYPYLILLEKYLRGHLALPKEKAKYDMFMYPGFAGLSLSSALASSISQPKHKAIALVGDGAFTCGEIYEALNHIGDTKNNILVIFNQNGMSIKKNVGALNDGTSIKQFVKGLKFDYIGPVDGHNTEELIKIFTLIKEKTTPVFLHVKTTKGKGCFFAEKDPFMYHQPFFPFDKENGDFIPTEDEIKKVFLSALELFEKKGMYYLENFHNLYFTMPATPPLLRLEKEYPTRVIDTAITEQHCMTMSTALAKLGNKVVMSMFAIFLTRCYSQLFDLCHQNAALVTILYFPGVTFLGPTHQAIYSISILKIIPNATILHPMNLEEYEKMLDFSLEVSKPIFLHVPKEDNVFEKDIFKPIEYGRGVILKKGKYLTVLPIGSMFSIALEIAEQFHEVEILNPRFLKPFDYGLLMDSIKKTGKLLILEDGLSAGGIGEEVISYLRDKNVVCEIKLVAAKNKFPCDEDFDAVKKDLGISNRCCMDAAKTFFV